MPYWQALAQDARGNISQFRFGNGVESLRSHDPATGLLQSAYAADASLTVVQDLALTFDTLGNLEQRADNRYGTVAQTLVENFYYDDLNRVVKSEAFTGGEQAVTSLILPVSMWTNDDPATTTIDVTYDITGKSSMRLS